jgi:hypothetical protein
MKASIIYLHCKEKEDNKIKSSHFVANGADK